MDEGPVAAGELAGADAFTLPAVVMARVTDVRSALWSRVRASWSRRIRCCVGALRRAAIQALVATSEGPVGVGEATVVGAVVVGAVVVGAVVVGAVVVDAVGVGEAVGGTAVAGGLVGKNGIQEVRAADAWPRSAAIALWALATRCWAWTRLLLAPAPGRPVGVATRGLISGVAVAAGVTVVATVVPVAPVPPPVPLEAAVVAPWSDSKVALALARVAWAATTELRSGPGSMVAKG